LRYIADAEDDTIRATMNRTFRAFDGDAR
jgi:hypothetical protein